MNKLFLILIIVVWTRFDLFSQQNFFNVPSSDITEKNKIFFQQQVNIIPHYISSNTTLSFGFRNNLEVGLNILGINYDELNKKFFKNLPNQQPVFPSYGLNIQKLIIELNKYSLTLGGQYLFPKNKKEDEYYLYLNNKIKLKNIKIVGGVFAGNNNYFGNETRLTSKLQKLGIQLGMEYEIIDDKLYFQTDFMSGRTVISNLILGGAYKITKQWIFSYGFQIPNSKNSSSKGLIFELTYNP